MIIQANDLLQNLPFKYQNIQYPPDIQKAEDHRRANSMFKVPQSTSQGYNQQTYKQCPCCGKIVGEPQGAQICYDPIQLGKLNGPGLPLFFSFLKFSIYLLMILIIVFGIVGTITNLTGKDCDMSQKCQNNDFTNKWSILNIYSKESIILAHKYLLMCIVIISPFFIMLVRYFFEKIKTKVDLLLQSESDYSIIIRKLDKKTTIQDIKSMFLEHVDFMDEQQRLKTHYLEIAQIYMAYQTHQYLHQKQQNVRQLKRCIKDKQSVMLYSTQKILQNRQFTGTAIICFQYHQSRQYFTNTSNCIQKCIKYGFQSYYRTSDIFRIGNKFVSIYRAPQPQDIIWENCGKSTLQLLIRKILSYVLSILILLIGLLIQFGIEKARFETLQNSNFLYDTLWGIGQGIIIMIINDLINIFLLIISNHQKDDTRTQILRSLIKKIILFNFINSGIFLIIVDILVKIPNENAIRESKLSLNIIYIIITNAIYQNILVFIFTYYEIDFQKMIKKCRYKNKHQIFTQRQLNKLMELPAFDFVNKFAYALRTIWLTAFFLPTVPIISLISFIGLLINYWIEKFLCTKCYKQPSLLSHFLAMQALQLLTYFSLWLIIGSVFIHFYLANFSFSQIPSAIMIPHYIGFGVSLILILVPYTDIPCFKLFSKNLNHSTDEKFTKHDEAVKKFDVTYDQTNPFYSCNYNYKTNEAKKMQFLRKKQTLHKDIVQTQRKFIR